MKKYNKPTVKWMEIESEEMMVALSGTNATEDGSAKGHSAVTDWDDDDCSNESTYSNPNTYGQY